jgi:large subunit ribosomal protein L15
MSVELHTLRPGAPNRRRKRVGRGIGSGHGKTSTKGQKGQKARSGGVKGPGFEGGQMPLQRRLPMRGFSNEPFRKVFEPINVGELNRFPSGTEVTPEALRAARLYRGSGAIKVLGEGELQVGLTVRAHAFSRSARAKIEAAGGRAEVLE